jgi:hypothetical protein
METKVIKEHYGSSRLITRVLFVSVLVLLTAASTAAQSSRKRQKDKELNGQSSTLDAYYPKKEYGPKDSKKKSQHLLAHDGEKHLHDRRTESDKDKRKAEKIMMSSQYAELGFFGHRRFPKRHKPRKMKYCRECGIRH